MNSVDPTPEGRAFERARQLVLAQGWNTTAYQILNPGFRYWFSAAGDAVVGHVRRSRVWVVGGAPVCAESRLDPVAREFEATAHAAGVRVCYVGAQDRLARRCLPDPGFSATVLGAEPYWDPARWAEQTSAHPSLRAQLHRARNKGVVTAVRPAGAAALPGLDTVLRGWLATKGLPPLGFLTTPWLLGDLRDRRLIVALRDDAPVGFLVLTPIPARRGWLIEQIVRGPRAPNGTAELLVDAAFRWMESQGARYGSLGLAPLVEVRDGQVGPDPWWLRWSLAWLRAHGRRFYNFRGLQQFKAKLGPAGWDPVYAIADETRLSLRTMRGVTEAVVGGSIVRFGGRMIAHAARAEVRRMTKGAR